MPDELSADDLRRREVEETTKEHDAVLPEEAHAARRRAEKAAYLAEKAEQQAEVDSRD